MIWRPSAGARATIRATPPASSACSASRPKCSPRSIRSSSGISRRVCEAIRSVPAAGVRTARGRRCRLPDAAPARGRSVPDARGPRKEDSVTARLWGGRFRGEPDPQIAAFTTSLPFDQRLYRADILGSIAHATMLGRSGIIAPDEAGRIVQGLREILGEVDAGLLKIEGAEDIHTFVESALRTRIGDAARRLHTARSRTDALPLGAAALAGTSYPIDPQLVADLLGFSSLCENSLDATADRDFAVEFVSAAATLMVHLSRLAGEIVLWATAEFGFVELLDAVAAGSSIMPQKKNPDAAELVRGKAGRVMGDLVTLLSILRGLPLAYNSDLQEDKEAVFDAVDSTNASLQAMGLILHGIRINTEAIAARLRGGFMGATEIADDLARRGMPFRDAHELVGRIVLYAQEQGRELWELTPDEYREFSPLLDASVVEATTPAGAGARTRSHGGTAPERVQEQVQAVRGALTENLSWLASLPAVPVEREAAAPGVQPGGRAPGR